MKAANETGFKQDVDRLGKGVGTLKTDVNNLAHGAADAARSGVAELRQGAQHAVDSAKDTATDAIDSFRDVIGSRPVASIGIAAGVGILVGLMISRRRS